MLKSIPQKRLAVLLATLVVFAGALFAIGVSLEGSGDGESSESSAHAEARGEAAEAGAESEKILGINPESPVLVALAIVFSIVLAAVVLVLPSSRPVMLGSAAVLLAFAAFDILEVVHQADRSDTGIAFIAATVAVLHVAAAALAFVLAQRASNLSSDDELRPIGAR